MGEIGRYYEKRWGCGMWHDKALEAVARERLKVITPACSTSSLTGRPRPSQDHLEKRSPAGCVAARRNLLEGLGKP